MGYKCRHCTRVLDSRYALAQHNWKKQDDKHSSIKSLDEGLEDASKAEEVNGDTDKLAREPETNDPTDSSTSSPSSTSSSGATPPFTHPAVPDGGTDTSSTVEPNTTDSDDPTCPECGSRTYFDARAAGFRYGCARCSTAESWTVWGEL